MNHGETLRNSWKLQTSWWIFRFTNLKPWWFMRLCMVIASHLIGTPSQPPFIGCVMVRTLWFSKTMKACKDSTSTMSCETKKLSWKKAVQFTISARSLSTMTLSTKCHVLTPCIEGNKNMKSHVPPRCPLLLHVGEDHTTWRTIVDFSLTFIQQWFHIALILATIEFSLNYPVLPTKGYLSPWKLGGRVVWSTWSTRSHHQNSPISLVSPTDFDEISWNYLEWGFHNSSHHPQLS